MEGLKTPKECLVHYVTAGHFNITLLIADVFSYIFVHIIFLYPPNAGTHIYH